MTTKQAEADRALVNLEKELGEPVLYRSTGRFLAAGGFGDVPLNSWGLFVLTPSRLMFHHFPNNHPLFGGADPDIRWEVSRDHFEVCEHRVQKFWTKVFSGIPDHLSLAGTGAHVEFELVDFPKHFLKAWTASP